jgi:hypothetical protein
MLINILLGLAVVGVTVVIQAVGTNFWLKKLKNYESRSSGRGSNKRVILGLIFTSSFLIFMHLVQAGLWAGLYVLVPSVDEFDTFEKAIYFSLVTFTTLGYGEITIDSSERILAGLEAVNGIILIGWSTAFMFAIYQQIVTEAMGDAN